MHACSTSKQPGPRQVQPSPAAHSKVRVLPNESLCCRTAPIVQVLTCTSQSCFKENRRATNEHLLLEKLCKQLQMQRHAALRITSTPSPCTDLSLNNRPRCFSCFQGDQRQSIHTNRTQLSTCHQHAQSASTAVQRCNEVTCVTSKM
jgi:hypothetical protein